MAKENVPSVFILSRKQANFSSRSLCESVDVERSRARNAASGTP